MSSQSLFLKYRSQTFDDIVEQEFTKQILKTQAIKSSQGDHFPNYLFYGSRGIGKTSIARIVARALNCLNLTDGNPCNTCANCELILSGKAIDIVEIDAASNTGIDNIRDEIIDKSIYPPAQLKKKVYIIDEVHMLSIGAFNALLKIMEEPPSYLVFILATTELHKVPETIASRCQVFNFKRITIEGIVGRLEYICKQEGIEYDIIGLQTIAKLADGGMRDAVKYLDQVRILGAVTSSNVSQCLGVTSDKTVQEFIEAIGSNNGSMALALVQELQTNNADVYIFLKEVLGALDKQLDSTNLHTLIPVIQFIKTSYEKLKYFPHPYVLLKAEVLSLGLAETNQAVPKVQPVAQPTTLQQPEYKQPDIQENKAQEQASISDTGASTADNNDDFEDLKNKIVDRIPGQSIKNIRESACYIESITGGQMVVHVIEKGKLILLNMAKNKQEVEVICSEILGKQIFVDYQFIEKEEFLRKGLQI